MTLPPGAVKFFRTALEHGPKPGKPKSFPPKPQYHVEVVESLLPIRAASTTSFSQPLATRCQAIDPFRLIDTAASTEWVVFAKPPFGGPEQVLAYLARYTHRIAISDRRIVGFDGQNVRFLWRDRRNGDTRKIMELSADEFLRRFLLHVLPDRFVRIRHFGCLANRLRTHVIASAQVRMRRPVPSRWETEKSIPPKRLCPQCKVGQMLFIETVEPEVPRIDSS